MNKRILFIGLGVMGYPMAGHLSKQHSVIVYNRTTRKSEQWVTEYEGSLTTDLKKSAIEADYIISCIGNDDDLRAVFSGSDGLIMQAKPGTVIIDHTTASANVARELSTLGETRDIAFIDAPISGGQAGAENGQLTIMCGGSKSAYEQAEPIMQCYARACQLMGDSGTGQLTKMTNQIAIAGLLQGLAECIHFAETAQLDITQVIDVISKGAAQSWQMENRAPTMIEGKYDYGFAVDWMRKDLGICLDEARQNGASLPMTAQIDQYYSDIQKIGGNRWDTSSLLERLRTFKDLT